MPIIFGKAFSKKINFRYIWHEISYYEISVREESFLGLRGSPIVQYVCRIIEKICIFLSLLKFKHIMSPNISSRI